MGTGIGMVAGLCAATAALTGCTPSTNTSAGGTTSTSAAASSTASTASTTTTTPGSTVSSTGTGTTTTASPADRAAFTSSCTPTELKVTQTSTGAAAGHVGWIVVFTNAGSTPCSVEGYPGAGITDKPGDVVLNATRTLVGYLGGKYPKPATIVLKPGGAASTVLEWLDAPLNGQTPVGANCPGMDSGQVLVTAPNTKQSTPFSAPPNLCADFEVHPLVPGTSGRLAQ